MGLANAAGLGVCMQEEIDPWDSDTDLTTVLSVPQQSSNLSHNVSQSIGIAGHSTEVVPSLDTMSRSIMQIIENRVVDTSSDIGAVFTLFRDLAEMAGEGELSPQEIEGGVMHTRVRLGRGIINEIIPSVISAIRHEYQARTDKIRLDLSRETSIVAQTRHSFELVNIAAMEKDKIIQDLRAKLAACAPSSSHSVKVKSLIHAATQFMRSLAEIQRYCVIQDKNYNTEIKLRNTLSAVQDSVNQDTSTWDEEMIADFYRTGCQKLRADDQAIIDGITDTLARIKRETIDHESRLIKYLHTEYSSNLTKALGGKQFEASALKISQSDINWPPDLCGTQPMVITAIDLRDSIRLLLKFSPSNSKIMIAVSELMFAHFDDPDSTFTLPNVFDLGNEDSILARKPLCVQKLYKTESANLFTVLRSIDPEAVDHSLFSLELGMSHETIKDCTAKQNDGLSVVSYYQSHHYQFRCELKDRYEELFGKIPGMFINGSLKEVAVDIRFHLRNAIRLGVRVQYQKTIKKSVIVLLMRERQFAPYLEKWLTLTVPNVDPEHCIQILDQFIGVVVRAASLVIDMPGAIKSPSTDLLSFRSDFISISNQIKVTTGAECVIDDISANAAYQSSGSTGSATPSIKYGKTSNTHTDIVCDCNKCSGTGFVELEVVQRMRGGKGPARPDGILCTVCFGVLRSSGSIVSKSGEKRVWRSRFSENKDSSVSAKSADMKSVNMSKDERILLHKIREHNATGDSDDLTEMLKGIDG